jgi:hypothetical protein
MVPKVATPSDTTGVRSRISWAAVAAGSLIALVVLLALGALGSAVGITITRGSVPEGRGSLVWAVIIVIVALFAGGWAMSRCEARETRGEAVLHGLVMWGAIYAGLVVLSYFGVFTGFNVVMGVEGMPISAAELAEIAESLGLAPDEAGRLAEIVNRPALGRGSVIDAWLSTAGIFASLAAAVFGALVGAGPRAASGRLAGRGPVETPA